MPLPGDGGKFALQLGEARKYGSGSPMAETTFALQQRHARDRGGLGLRLRQLRLAAGLTQTQLAGERFSKGDVSQIERGKTRPTEETVDWLAGRLGIDRGFLATGVSSDERGRAEAVLAR